MPARQGMNRSLPVVAVMGAMVEGEDDVATEEEEGPAPPPGSGEEA